MTAQIPEHKKKNPVAKKQQIKNAIQKPIKKTKEAISSKRVTRGLKDAEVK